MIPSLSHFLMIIALLCAAQGFAAGVICFKKPQNNLASLLPIFFDAMLCCIWGSVALLVYSFLISDFSLWIVFEHVQTNLPWYYKLGALWAGHEGSMVLWLFVLTLWSAVYRQCNLPAYFKQTSMTILLSIFLLLLLFIVLASSPFERIFPYVPIQGQDLNPLLQDLGMMFHPPLLYVGYVGFAIPYAMVMSALLTRDDKPRVNVLFQKMVLSAWGFLTLGITLGSFWAYYELGWGGFWFWDPVENASLLPWLIATALVHAMRVPDAWEGPTVILLTIWAFVLSLLGTFLVRSGLLSSVHSFASDPARGLFILLIVFFFWGAGHYIYFKYKKSKHTALVMTSRESFLTLNQICFIVIAAIVFLGTIYPLLIEAMQLGFISVGPQYFNRMILPLGGLVMLLMGLSVSTRFHYSIKEWNAPLMIALLSLSVFIWAVSLVFWAKVGLALFVWVVLNILYDFRVNKITLKRAAMHLSHFGFATLVLGIALSQTSNIEKEQALSVGETLNMAGSIITLDHLENVVGANYDGVRAYVHIDAPGKKLMVMEPEKRFYTFRNIAVTETAIQGNIFHDWYIALGEPIDEKTWSFRIHYQSYIRLIWIGGILMALGMFVAVLRRK